MDKELVFGSDHAGFELKEFLISKLNDEFNIVDLGTDSNESCDFPDYSEKVCSLIQKNSNYKGVLICGTGVGMSIAANKFKGIRAANVVDIATAKQSVEHNNANVLCLGSKNVDKETAVKIVQSFLSSSLLMDEKYSRRIKKIEN